MKMGMPTILTISSFKLRILYLTPKCLNISFTLVVSRKILYAFLWRSKSDLRDSDCEWLKVRVSSITEPLWTFSTSLSPFEFFPTFFGNLLGANWTRPYRATALNIRIVSFFRFSLYLTSRCFCLSMRF